MNPKDCFLLGIVFCLSLLAIWRWRQSLARKQMLTTIKMMASSTRKDIGGQSVEQCLDILNQDTTRSLVTNNAMVLTYKRQEFFFVEGTIACLLPTKSALGYRRQEAYFLIAIGQSAVRLLSEKEHVFRLMIGSTDLAAFSIFRWSDFVDELITEKP
jgi:hypothetical protein